jgi:osmotically-inducible protein OsmY
MGIMAERNSNSGGSTNGARGNAAETAAGQATARQVRAALEFDTGINLHRFPVDISVAGDAVVLEGEVESLAAKKLALGHAGGVPGIRGVVDRLRVSPSERRGDAAIRISVCNFVLAESEFANAALRVHDKGRLEVLREASGEWTNTVEVAVEDGVITLEGKVISLSHKRLAGVLAWWTPGCRDVINALEIDPPESDSDEEIVEALTLILEVDPEVDAGQLRARCAKSVVTLDGYVVDDLERRRAEFDAWAVFGVDRVVNHIALQT